MGSGYKTLASNLQDFYRLDSKLLPSHYKVLNEGGEKGVENGLVSNRACWHKSCALKYNSNELNRAKKRYCSETVKNTARKSKRRRESAECSKKTCFFCDQPENKESLHNVSTFGLDSRIRQIVLELQDEKLLAKLSSGDMVALEASYHKSCLTALYNKARSESSILYPKKNSVESEAHGIVLAELVSYMEESRSETKGVLVFRLKELANMYTSRLRQLGFAEKSVNSSRLKDRLLTCIPNLQAHQQGRDILLAYENDIGIALQKVVEDESDTDAKSLAKAAAIVRKGMLSSKSTFQGTFEKHCQKESVPSSLISLVKMILYGPSIQDQLEHNISQAALTVAQLLKFNCSSRRREESTGSGRHNRDRETPVPLYVGHSTHALTRKRELVDSLYKLGISISYDRVLSISTDIGNAVCRRFEEDGVLCQVKLRKALFITAAIDNIDHNLKSNTAQGSFHGTGISLFQNTSPGNTGVERNTVILKQNEDASSKTICPLPKWYTEVPPCVLRNKSVAITLTNGPEIANTNPVVLERALIKEYEWLEEVRASTKSDLYHGEKPITWSGYHASFQTELSFTPAITSLFPLFPDEAKSVAMIRHAMNVIKTAIQFLNPGQIPVIAVDQPLYSIAKQIQWNVPDTHGEQHFVFMLGGLHIEMAILSVLGDWLEDSGWVNAVVEANIATAGVAKSILKASNVKRTRHAHHVTVSTLYCLLLIAYNLAKENGIIEDTVSIQD